MRFYSLISHPIYVQRRNSMRVVGGIYKRRLITYPNDSEHIRPTKDRIREAIFSAVGDLSNDKGLDLYSGSGAMGIEGLSRGCSSMVFVDNNKIAIETTKNNIKSLGITNAEVLFKNDFTALEQFKSEKRVFDVIFLDPPYKQGKYEELVSYLLDNNLINKNGIIVMESDRDIDIDESLFKNVRKYKYGEIKVVILWR